MTAVRFEPAGKAGDFESGTTILEAALALGVEITAPCGGKGRCGRCLVTVEGECSEPSSNEEVALSAEDLASGLRLACEAKLIGDTVVTVLQDSQTNGSRILSEGSSQENHFHPNVAQRTVELEQPSLEDQRSDCLRLGDALGIPCRSLTADLAVLRHLPSVLRTEEFQVKAVTVGSRLARALPASAQDRCLGAAVDIGTTTVVLHLVDLETGERIGTASALNPQARYGHDLISRIEHASASGGGLADLQSCIVRLINDLLLRAASEASVSTNDVFEVTVVGNTAMHHMFLGLDPTHLAASPYVPVAAAAIESPAGKIGLAINPAANVYSLPLIAGFVGADTVAVLLVSELTSCKNPTLAIDIGTNGEVMLWANDRLLVTSCAAGPAFEGGEISHGVRAASGAIEHVTLVDDDLQMATINDDAPNGICGSGIFDVVAAMLASGAVEVMGRLADADDAEGLAPGIAARLRGEKSQREFVLVPSDHAADDRDIVFTQKDLREVQLAKGAIRAAVELLCIEAGIGSEELDEVLLAGAFGNYIDPNSALRIGLLPPIERERITGIGNAAGAGALTALLSTEKRAEAEALAEQAEHIELMARTEFQMVYADSMIFPDA